MQEDPFPDYLDDEDFEGFTELLLLTFCGKKVAPHLWAGTVEPPFLVRFLTNLKRLMLFLEE